jgi:sugar phosphate isomerase/epimerase
MTQALSYILSYRLFMSHLSRRALLASSLGLVMTTTSTIANPYKTLGVGLYTVRDAIKVDPLGTLKTLKALGYDQIELIGLGGLTAKASKAIFEEVGLSAPSCHMPPETWYAAPERTLDTIAELGATYAVLAWIPKVKREAISLSDTLNKWGALAKARGLKMTYHNHDFEFKHKPSEKSLYHRLMELTDPSLVDFELDIYWAKFAGHDPLHVLTHYAQRIKLLHLKDISKKGAMTPVGSGHIDFKTLLSEAFASGVTHVFVEDDNAPKPFESLRLSANYLKSL